MGELMAAFSFSRQRPWVTDCVRFWYRQIISATTFQKDLGITFMTGLVAFDPLSCMATIFPEPRRRGLPASPRFSVWMMLGAAIALGSACNSARRSGDGRDDGALGGVANTGGNTGGTNDAARVTSGG